MKTLFFVVLSIVALSAASQKKETKEPKHYSHSIDIKSGVILPVGDTEKYTSVGVLGYYDGKIILNKGFFIPLEARILALSAPPVNERFKTVVEPYTTPAALKGFGGIGWSGNDFTITLRGFGQNNLSNRWLAMPYSPSTDTAYTYGRLKENQFWGGDITLALVNDNVNLQLYSFNHFTSQDYMNDVNASLDSSGSINHDWWVRSSALVNIIDTKLMATGYVLYRNDMVSSNAYDLAFARLGVATDLRIKRKLHIWGELSARNYTNRRMEQRNYLSQGGFSQNFGLYGHLRSFYQFKKKLYLKADFKIDASKEMTKIRYNVGVKKTWRKQHIDGTFGYWSTPGSLFPQHGLYYQGSFGLTDNLAIIPSAKLYWQWDRQEEGFNYSRGKYGVELAYTLAQVNKPLFRRLTFLGGVSLQKFSDTFHFYNDQLAFYIGARTHL